MRVSKDKEKRKYGRKGDESGDRFSREAASPRALKKITNSKKL
jgi:hypothetical protein